MRYSKSLRCLMALALPAVILMGCSSPKGIAVNDRQTVVMDSPVLTAGILADNPSISDASGRVIATSELSNSQSTPVTVHYRFYWYDDQGLDIRPFEAPRTITIAPNSDATIYSLNGNLDAKRVRLYLFL
ncbi:Predicted periplasmic lipoprotein [Serratia liquefaciens]|uniref:YcfL family protein n=1 Tax=Serratia liquefaciens TaxID=614 RepID=UPI0021796D90|nr:YcfL family protein [Serratia liquefaciens]CAI0894062.1 Predicted periplasmic lipoprotein [Serratia liquefaciens]